jgi:hypothetical protein
MVLTSAVSSINTCPGCGVQLSLVAIGVKDEGGITLREKLKAKVRHGLPGTVKPHLEKTVGDDLQRSTGQWLNLERTVDRENDYYRERLTNPQTGEVLDKQERLSEHQGHGAAKRPATNCPETGKD